MQIKRFTFNPFQENTYLLFDQTRETIIIDPGCSSKNEEEELYQFIAKHNLKPVSIVNTHCHIDHVFGINALKEKYNIPFYCHKDEIPVLESIPAYAPIYGLRLSPIDPPNETIDEQSIIRFGTTRLSSRFTPGHSPASLCFIHEESRQVIAGDVLFEGSIGRTDLPGGNYETLMQSITTQLLPLDDDYKVYPGHGESTTIGKERKTNPFILEYLQ